MFALQSTLRSLFVAAALIGGAVFGASAQISAQPLPGDPHLVKFPYNADNSYRIFTRPLAVTNIVLEDDERLKILVLGDTASFIAQKSGNQVFIKPVFDGRQTWGTLTTNKRTYQLHLISTGEGGKYYQRVSWLFADMLALGERDADIRDFNQLAGGPPESVPAPVIAQGERTESREASAEGFDPAALNFKYEVVGKARFKPVAVFDDGKRTTIRLPDDADVPAVFRIVGKEIELLDYTQSQRASNVILIPRVVDGILLRLGNDEVRVFNMTKVRKTFFGSFDMGAD